ncbi:MAG: endonuclease NucS domain-containing protein [Phycisphaerales bacterium JB054]
MPIEVGLWKLGDRLQPVAFTGMDSESRLESVLAGDISVVDPGWLLIGRQVPTAFGKFIDLLAIDAEGQLIVIELKKNRTPREVVAQLLDYGSWVRALEDDEIASVFESFVSKYHPEHKGTSLDEAFCERFKVEEIPESLNEAHKLVLVASELDDSSERIITYLAEEYGVSINAVFFRVFRDGESEYLSRAWLTDPGQVDAKVEAKREKLPWNGEFYASFSADDNRDWEEARKYGFISAGGGAWYSRSLGLLEPGGRVWVNIPGGVGYVGVGIVKEPVVPVDEFMVDNGNGKMVPITSLPVRAAQHTTAAQNPDKAEHMVRIEWIKTVPLADAVKEKGFFGNQNSAAKPRARSWLHTVDRLKQRFGLSSDSIAPGGQRHEHS